MTTTAPLADNALDAADRLAAALADPAAVWPDGPPPGGRAWPQSLAGGASGIALLHLVRARTGHGDWATARTWISAAVNGQVSAAANANLYFGAPTLAYLLHHAVDAEPRYAPLLRKLDTATVTVTRRRLAAAHHRIDRQQRPPMEEFDLIQGLTGLAAYHLARHPDHDITHDTLAYLVRLTQPVARAERDELPPWWMDVAPSGAIDHPNYPDGHGNFGMSHGISSTLAVLAQALLADRRVPGHTEALVRICAWTDAWRQGTDTVPWWPGQITAEQAHEGTVHPDLNPRPSWCYGVAGTARAQQLAALALQEPERARIAEAAVLAALTNPVQLDQLSEPGLCHGVAGLLHCAGRIAATSGNTRIAARLPVLALRLNRTLQPAGSNPELLDGTAGAALALHTLGTGYSTPAPHWDTFLALA
ncbi:hypothetical protein ABH931_005241 [Streptacidiphilus sp. MAP12-33]|uniref:lanthionine synthetase C family protein n=1 Tax=Streptacidiphilus sp. MAP12-33 TaxID=3156266 RepID=UPI0035186BD0